MTTVKQHRTHDMLQLRVSYAKGTSLTITCSRNGERITMQPEDFETALKLGALIAHVKRGMSAGNSTVPDFGTMFDILESSAKRSSGYAAFADDARTALAMPDGLPPPRQEGTPPATTQARCKAGRSVSLTIQFASGERTDLKISRSSVSIKSDPSVCVLDDRIMGFAFSARPMGYEPQVTAEALAAYATQTNDLTGFVKGLSLSILTSPAP